MFRAYLPSSVQHTPCTSNSAIRNWPFLSKEQLVLENFKYYTHMYTLDIALACCGGVSVVLRRPSLVRVMEVTTSDLRMHVDDQPIFLL